MVRTNQVIVTWALSILAPPVPGSPRRQSQKAQLLDPVVRLPAVRLQVLRAHGWEPWRHQHRALPLRLQRNLGPVPGLAEINHTLHSVWSRGDPQRLLGPKAAGKTVEKRPAGPKAGAPAGLALGGRQQPRTQRGASGRSGNPRKAAIRGGGRRREAGGSRAAAGNRCRNPDPGHRERG